MKVIFRRSFLKDIRGLDKTLARRVEGVLSEVEEAESLQDIRNLRRLAGKSLIAGSGLAIIGLDSRWRKGR